MPNTNQKRPVTEMHTEQSAANIQIAVLGDLDPMSQDFPDKLEHIRFAVTHHVAEEEGEYLLQLKETADAAMNSKLTERHFQEFARYMGGEESN